MKKTLLTLAISALATLGFAKETMVSSKTMVNSVNITTSCGGSYSVSCNGCTTSDYVSIALALDDLTC